MKTNQRPYIFEDSDARIREILNASDQNYQELDYIPSTDRLTYTNGFYVNCCTALFIDIRGSSKLTDSHTRPVVGKIYRAYLSECVAILNQDPNCKQVYIQGDCVIGIFETRQGADMNNVLFRAFELNALVGMLNWRLEQKGYTPISCGIGIDYGRALMMQGGFSSTGINETIWMGEVVNRASNLCSQGNKNGQLAIQMSTTAFNKLTRQDYKNLLYPVQTGGLLNITTHYQGDAVSVAINNKVEAEKARSRQRAATSNLIGLLGIGLQPPTRLGATLISSSSPAHTLADLLKRP